MTETNRTADTPQSQWPDGKAPVSQTADAQPAPARRWLNGATLSVADQCVSSATNFLTSILIARACGKEELGLYVLGFTTALIVLELQSTLVTTPYLVFAPRLQGDERARYSGSILLHQLGLGLVGVALAGVGAWLASTSPSWLPAGIGTVFFVLMAALPCMMFRDFVRRVCFARQQMKSALLVDIAVFVLQISALGFLAFDESLSAAKAYGVIAASTLVPAALWCYLARDSFQAGPWRQDLQRNLQLGGWLFASGLLWAISANIYPWLLADAEGTGAAGVWGACLQLLALANIPLLGTQNFLGPKLTHLYVAEGMPALRRFALRTSVLFGGAILLVALALWALADFALGLVYGADFRGNATTVLFLVLHLATVAAAFPLSRGLFAIERAGADFAVNLVPVTLLFAVGIPLIHSHGLVGGALGLFISGAAAVVVRAVVFLAISRSRPDREPAGGTQ